MADSTLLTQDEMALRRRARRRLVGAVAIALAAVVVLPMLFDPEPKPLGPEVDIRIPAKDTPFDVAPGAPAAPVPAPADEPAPREAEPTLPTPAPAKPVAEATDKTAPAGMTAPATKPDEAKPAEAKPVETKAAKPAEKEHAKMDNAAVDAKAGKKVAETGKPDAKADAAFASKGYFLQLGAFGSEANAKHLVEKAQAAGFKVVLSSGNGQYRVRLGPFPEHAKALEAQAKLKAKGFSPVLMGP